MTVVPFFIAHHGCPHQCVFCDQNKIAGAGGALPSEAELLGKIAAYRRTAGDAPVQVAFFGGTFTALPIDAQLCLLQPLQPLLADGVISDIRISTRPDYIDPINLETLRRLGVKMVELGIQSMSDDVLRRAGRGHTAADVELAAAVLRDSGVGMGAQLMPGLPGGTREEALESLEKVIRLRPECLRIYPTIVINGTPLAELQASGDYEPMTLPEAVSLCGTMLLRALNADVQVIRMGLQPTEELEAPGAIVCGPYHPAFRYLVEADLCRKLFGQLLQGVDHCPSLLVSCAPERVSTVIGHRRSNIEDLENRYGVKVRVQSDLSLSPFEIVVHLDGQDLRGHLLRDLAEQFNNRSAKEAS